MFMCNGRKNDGTPCQSTIVLENGFCRVHQAQVTKPYRWSRELLENAIRANDGPEWLDLAGDDLSSLDLSGMDLREIILGKYIKELHVFCTADLTNTALVGSVLSGALLVGCDLATTALAGADLSGAHFNYAILHGTELWGAQLKEAVFCWASLYRTDLRFTDLSGADLRRADIVEVDLLDTKCLHGLRLHRAKIRDTLLEHKQLGDSIGDELEGNFAGARYAYLALKRNFEDLGDYDAASWAYIKERQMEKKCNSVARAREVYGEDELGDTRRQKLPQYHPKVCWFYVRHFCKWLIDWLVELICGYGERPGRTLLAMGLVIAAFAGVYWRTWSVFRIEDTPTLIRYVPTRNLGDLLVFSLVSFTTMDPQGLAPRSPWVQIVAAIEALLGIGLTGLLGFVIGNRIRRS